MAYSKIASNEKKKQVSIAQKCPTFFILVGIKLLPSGNMKCWDWTAIILWVLFTLIVMAIPAFIGIYKLNYEHHGLENFEWLGFYNALCRKKSGFGSYNYSLTSSLSSFNVSGASKWASALATAKSLIFRHCFLSITNLIQTQSKPPQTSINPATHKAIVILHRCH